jgi:hypothetical protein
MRKLLLGSPLLAGAIAISGCFGGLKAANDDGLKLATALHKQMAQGDLAGIYNNAAENYRKSVPREMFDAQFSAIARKLGAPLDCKPAGIAVNVDRSGTTIRSKCETHFSKDATGEESFVWFKSGDQFQLLSYNINSRELSDR